MRAKKSDSAASTKRKTSKKAVSSRKVVSPRKPSDGTTNPKKARSRPGSPPITGHTQSHQEGPGDAGVKPVKFYLAREGVAFGPYTEFQVLESIRLGIFESNDLALAEDGTEWLEVSALLPVNRVPRERQPDQPPSPPRADKDGSEWPEVSALLPLLKAPREQQPSHKSRFRPLTAQQLREHERLSATPFAAFIGELARGRFAFAAIPTVVMILGLLTLAATLKHREPSALAAAHPRFSQKPPALQAPAKASPPLTRVSLSAHYVPPAGVVTTTGSETLTASAQIPEAVVYQRAHDGHAP